MSDILHLEKPGPIKLLESRRDALTAWLAEGQDAIREAERAAAAHKAQAIEMLAEIEEIEAALNTLNAALPKEPENG